MSNVNPQSNNVKYASPKDSDQKEKDDGKKPVIPLEEDDEFEDFPVEGNLPTFPPVLIKSWALIWTRLGGSRVTESVYQVGVRGCRTTLVG